MKRASKVSLVVPKFRTTARGVTVAPESTVSEGARSSVQATSRTRTTTEPVFLSLAGQQSLLRPVEQRVAFAPRTLAVQEAKVNVAESPAGRLVTVSYTHLTLPTILLV